MHLRPPVRLVATVFLAIAANAAPSLAENDSADATRATRFTQEIEPLFREFCRRCHHADEMKSGIRVDQLSADPDDRQLQLLQGIRRQIADGSMPPEDEPQFSSAQQQRLLQWIDEVFAIARTRPTPVNGLVRRLTVAQYRNTLKDLLGIDEELVDLLPPDAVSKEGFTNNVQTLSLSPLQVEAYFEIAEKALAICLVDEQQRPAIQRFRMEFGTNINPTPCPDQLILGANSELLRNADFQVLEPPLSKPFAFEHRLMRKHYDFIEGYAGNDTVRGWRKYDSIYHSVFACTRGTPGYPKGLACQVVGDGLMLRPAIPSPEIFGQSNTYGPMANFKISLRELPDDGNFRVTVRASRPADGLMLDAGSPAATATVAAERIVADLTAAPKSTLTIPTAGVYQLDVEGIPKKQTGLLNLFLGNHQFTGQLPEGSNPAATATPAADDIPLRPFLVVRLPAGPLEVAATLAERTVPLKLWLTKLPEESAAAAKFRAFEQRIPSLGVHVGLRRDCGSTLTQVGGPQRVANEEPTNFQFEGAIRNFPSPDVEPDNVNYLAGIREIGVRSEYTDGRDMPRLLVHAIEFEGPFYTAWPPERHRQILPGAPPNAEPALYAWTVLERFATRAYRRPATTTEVLGLVRIWQEGFSRTGHFQQSIQDALLVALTSPQFLFLIENSASPEPEDLEPYELASKLSYFLWNSPPDEPLLTLAAEGQLVAELDSQITRMIADPRFERFVDVFATQWLSLDKFDVVSIDNQRFPKLTRDVKARLRQEPAAYLRHLFVENRPVRQLIDADEVLADEVVASYYGLGAATEQGFAFVPIAHRRNDLGGVLTQAAILAGLSDGRESNPIKRGAWFARKIIAEPPDDPPPNVPRIKEDDGSKLTLREKLEIHRNQTGCVKCHTGIDPWGMPFEGFSAAGLKKSERVETHSRLPDGAEVQDLNDLKAHLVRDRLDQIAFSLLKHLACYSTGRSLRYNEVQALRDRGPELRDTDYRCQDLLRFVVKSDLFLKK